MAKAKAKDGVYTKSGKGRKQCPHCHKYVPVRTVNCLNCGKVIPLKKAIPTAIPIPAPKTPITKETLGALLTLLKTTRDVDVVGVVLEKLAAA
jgi:ribosomal protein S26